MISINRVKKLYEKLYEVGGVGNINYHQFGDDDHLRPIYMMGSDMVSDAGWKAKHAEMKDGLRISTDIVLTRISKGETVYVYDVPNDPAASPAFRAFGIYSLVVWPLYAKDWKTVNGLICIPDFFGYHVFTPEVIEKCGELIKEFNRDINEEKANTTVAEALTNYLGKNGVKQIFSNPCSTFSPIGDTLLDMKEIEYVKVSNESCAGFSAEMYAKLTGKVGVCLVAGAVGVPNALNGILQAKQSKSPILVLSGYVNSFEQGLGAMHDFEAHKLLDHAVKYNKVIRHEGEILTEVKKALEIAMTPPMGPVHIGIPLDILKEIYSGQDVPIAQGTKLKSDLVQLKNAVELINNSKNGLLIVGGGCRGLTSEVKQLAEKLNWRIYTTTGGKPVINEDFYLNLGNFGFASTDMANDVVLKDESIETVIALGTQLTGLATLGFNKKLTENRKLIHIDNDNDTFNKAYKADIKVLANLKYALDYLINKTDKKEKVILDRPYLNKPVTEIKGLAINEVYQKITELLPKNTVYVSDLGTTMQYSFKYLNIPEEGDFYCNTLQACMGASIGAIGVSHIDKTRPIATFVGDGSFCMSYIGELLTIKDYNLPIVTFVLNNSALEFVRIGHDIIHGRHPQSFETSYIDVSKIAEGFGISSLKVKELKDLDVLKDYNFSKPLVVELIIEDSSDMPLGRLELLKNK